MIACFTEPAVLIIKYHSIEEQRTIIRVLCSIENTSGKRSNKIMKVFVVALKITDKNRIIEIGKSEGACGKINDYSHNGQP